MAKALDLDPALVCENKFEDVLVRLNHIKVQPSAMGFYTVDSRLWPGVRAWCQRPKHDYNERRNFTDRPRLEDSNSSLF